jgi:hypothetical protein
MERNTVEKFEFGLQNREHLHCSGNIKFLDSTMKNDKYHCSTCNMIVNVIVCPSYYDYHPEERPY